MLRDQVKWCHDSTAMALAGQNVTKTHDSHWKCLQNSAFVLRAPILPFFPPVKRTLRCAVPLSRDSWLDVKDFKWLSGPLTLLLIVVSTFIMVVNLYPLPFKCVLSINPFQTKAPIWLLQLRSLLLHLIIKSIRYNIRYYSFLADSFMKVLAVFLCTLFIHFYFLFYLHCVM